MDIFIHSIEHRLIFTIDHHFQGNDNAPQFYRIDGNEEHVIRVNQVGCVLKYKKFSFSELKLIIELP